MIARALQRVEEPAERELYLPSMATVRRVEQVTDTEKLFEIALPGGKALGHQPGQFVEVSMYGYGEAPISICSAAEDGPNFELCIRRTGMLTNALHKLQAGASVGIRGPFGTGFPVAQMEGKDLLVVAGGIGLAPLRSIIRHVLANRKKYRRFIILHGAKSPAEMLFLKEWEQWGKRGDVEMFATVDKPAPGWNGNVGVITTLFQKVELDAKQTVATVVGPPVMYRFVLLELQAKGIPHNQIYFSVERRMKCGVGKCGHCQVNGVYVCQEGPVFSLPKLKTLWEATEARGPVRH
ncbi:MAG TPA: FAD/NAD(P)-binding protein [Planctomycetota bacterium]|jgi:sulfite reductase subunit B